MTNTYVALDIETTGLNPVNDKITEIGAVKYINGIETDRINFLVNPGIHIPERITQITGIDDNTVKDAPPIEDVITDVMDFVDGYILLGHNICFDYKFLVVAAASVGIKYTARGIDTHKIARKYLPDLSHRSLEALCEYFEIETVHHRALDDAISASVIYGKLCENRDEENFVFSLEYKPVKKEPATAKQIKFLEDLIKRYKIEPEDNIKSLTKSEASRMIDNILSSYGIVHTK